MKNREIDALIAEHVMGWTDIGFFTGGNEPKGCPNDDYNEDYPNNKHWEWVLNYSTDIAAAWEVVKKLVGECDSIEMSKVCGSSHFHCYINNGEGVDKSAPMAICKAALKEKGVEIE